MAEAGEGVGLCRASLPFKFPLLDAGGYGRPAEAEAKARHQTLRDAVPASKRAPKVPAAPSLGSADGQHRVGYGRGAEPAL